MEKEELLGRINRVLSQLHDPESAHSSEDQLLHDVIYSFCPDWVKEEIKKLEETDFPRWCA